MSTLDKLFSNLVDEVAAEAEKRVLERLETLSVPEKVFSAQEAADYLGISSKLVYQMATEKQIPHIQAGNLNSSKPRILFRMSSLDKWLLEQETASIRQIKAV